MKRFLFFEHNIIQKRVTITLLLITRHWKTSLITSKLITIDFYTFGQINYLSEIVIVP